jgi:hypothetical protein
VRAGVEAVPPSPAATEACAWPTAASAATYKQRRAHGECGYACARCCAACWRKGLLPGAGQRASGDSMRLRAVRERRLQEGTGMVQPSAKRTIAELRAPRRANIPGGSGQPRADTTSPASASPQRDKRSEQSLRRNSVR